MYGQTTSTLPRPAPAAKLERSLLEHLPMVRFLARRIHGRLPRNVEFDDLFSAGLVGLTEAAAKFDPAKNVGFVSYAQFRVRGAILDSLRLLDWAPRELRRKGRAIQDAIRTLTSRLGHVPSEEEVASEMNTSLDAYQKSLGDLSSLEIGTLHRKREDDSGDDEMIDVPARPEDDPLSRCMQGEIGKRMIAAIDALPSKERLVTSLYYYEDMTRNEIAFAMGVDVTRVTQIRASAVLHLRTALSDISHRGGRNPGRPHRGVAKIREHCLQPAFAR